MRQAITELLLLITISAAACVATVRRYGLVALLNPEAPRGRHAGVGRGSRQNQYTRHDGTDGSVSWQQTLINIRSIRLPRGKELLPAYPGSHYDMMHRMGIPA